MRRTTTLLAKPRVVILGSGWGGFALAKNLNPARFDVTIVSPRNHMLFTVRGWCRVVSASCDLF